MAAMMHMTIVMGLILVEKYGKSGMVRFIFGSTEKVL